MNCDSNERTLLLIRRESCQHGRKRLVPRPSGLLPDCKDYALQLDRLRRQPGRLARTPNRRPG